MKVTNLQSLKAEFVDGKWKLNLHIETGFLEDGKDWVYDSVDQFAEDEDFYVAYANALALANTELVKDADDLPEQSNEE